MSGAELIELDEKRISKGRLTVLPAFPAEGVDPKRRYRIVTPPYMIWTLRGRGRNLTDVEAGPTWRQEEWWPEIFGP